MIVHVCLLNFVAPLDPTQTREIFDGFSRLAKLIPEIKSYTFGPDLELRSGNAQYALVAEFENEEHFVIYRDNPEHIAFAKTVMAPLIKSVQSSQFTKNQHV